MFESGGHQKQAFPRDSFLTARPGLLYAFLWQKSVEADVVSVVIHGHFVGTGLYLLWFLWAERIGSAVPDVHLQLQQDLEGALELHLAAETNKGVS